MSSPPPPMVSAGVVPGPQHGLGRGAVDVACVAGQRFGLADPGDRQQLTHRGARGQVVADETGPAPAQGQPRRGRVSGQGAGEVGDEVLVAAVGRAGPEHEPVVPRSGPARPPARHSARRRAPAAACCRRPGRPPGGRGRRRRCRAAPPARRAAARRRCRTPPWPARNGRFGRVTLGGRDRGQLRPLRRRVRGRRLRPRERRPPLPRLAVHRRGQPVQRGPVRAPGGRPRTGQPGHAERLDHVVIQQELRPGRDPARRGEPAQPAAAPARPPPAVARPRALHRSPGSSLQPHQIIQQRIH